MPSDADRFYGVQQDLFLDSEVAAVLYVDEVLDGHGKFQYLDRVASVSALSDSDRACVLERKGLPSIGRFPQRGLSVEKVDEYSRPTSDAKNLSGRAV